MADDQVTRHSCQSIDELNEQLRKRHIVTQFRKYSKGKILAIGMGPGPWIQACDNTNIELHETKFDLIICQTQYTHERFSKVIEEYYGFLGFNGYIEIHLTGSVEHTALEETFKRVGFSKIKWRFDARSIITARKFFPL